MSGRTRESTGGRIIPALRYEDAPRAIEWLCDAFGFEKKLVVPGEGGKITHSQLTLENGMIMVGSRRENEPGGVDTPSALGGNTQGIYAVVEDPDAHCARARAAGAEILMEPADQHQGGRLYTCVDPGGYVWNFGSYDPWAGP